MDMLDQSRVRSDCRMRTSTYRRGYNRKSYCYHYSWSVFLSAFWVAVITKVNAGSTTTTTTKKSSSDKDTEYSFMILDPEHPYGSPYGGFSRATSSRLSSLPLLLPNVGENKDVFQPFFTRVSDASGQSYVCRAYHEDELDPTTLEDGMFVPPVFRKENEVDDDNSRDSVHESSKVDETSSKDDEVSSKDETSSSSSTSSENTEPFQDGDKETTTTTSSTVDSPEEDDSAIRDQMALDSLSQLEGMCAQSYQGYWSYEWCMDGTVTQFHIRHEISEERERGYSIESLTNLGEFRKRRATVLARPPGGSSTSAEISEDGTATVTTTVQKGSRIFVSSIHDDGDMCPEIGRPRSTEAILMCCPSEKSSGRKHAVLYNGKPMETDLLYVQDVSESTTCRYTITLCTPLLCTDNSVSAGGEGSDTTSPSTIGRTIGDKTTQPKEIENIQDLSVSEVIDIVFPRDKKSSCIILGDGSWWSYELCPGQHVRQYHEVVVMDRVTGVKRLLVETEHFLGRFDPESTNLSKEDELQHIVNPTAATVGGGGGGGSGSNSNNQVIKTRMVPPGPLSHGGNGAYFFQEYKRGDVCDHETVTDSAIKAGEVGEGLVERSTTVRYGCGTDLRLTVKEDSTCHYVADVTFPALCQHPLFRAPVSKRQVVKCIPEVQL